MRVGFKSYYEPTKADFKKLWAKSIIVFDTNVLLNLYRFQPDSVKQWFDILTSYKERLWIPHHVCLEYHQKRADVIKQHYRAYDEISSKVQGCVKSIQDMGLEERHSAINPQDLVKDIESILKKHTKKFEKLTLTGKVA